MGGLGGSAASTSLVTYGSGFPTAGPPAASILAGQPGYPGDRRIRLDLDDIISMINPKGTPFTNVLLDRTRQKDCHNTRFEWMEDEYFVARSFQATLWVSTAGTAGANNNGFGGAAGPTAGKEVWLQLTNPGEMWQAIESLPVSEEAGGPTTVIGATNIRLSFYDDDGSGFPDFAKGKQGYIRKAAITNGKDGTASLNGRNSVGLSGYTGTKLYENWIKVAAPPNDDDNKAGNIAGEIIGVGGTGATDGGSNSSYPTAIGTWNLDTADSGQPVHVIVEAPGEQNATVANLGYQEGSGLPPETRKPVAMYWNHTEIFKTKYSITNTMKAVLMHGIPQELQRIIGRKVRQHKTTLEMRLLFGGGGTEATHWGVVEAGDNPRRVTKGLGVGAESFIGSGRAGFIKTFNGDTNTNFQISETITSSTMGTIEDQIFYNIFSNQLMGSQDKLWLQSKRTRKAVHKAIKAEATHYEITPNTKMWGLDVDTLHSPYGRLHMADAPLFYGIYDPYGVILDMDNITIRPLRTRNTHTVLNAQPNDIDGEEHYIITELGLQCKHESTHAITKLVA